MKRRRAIETPRQTTDAAALIARLESQPLSQQLTAESTYELLRRAAERHGDAPALTFLATGADDEPAPTLSHQQLLGRIHRTANAFTELGLGPTDVVSTLLPHLPETHEVFWGGQAAGIVNPINFLLRTEEIAELLNAARTRILVASGPHPALDIWPKVEHLKARVPTLEHILQVTSGGAPVDDSGGALDFRQVRDAQRADALVTQRQIRSHELAAYFHTGGTTGSPKLARHTHGNEVFTAWALGKVFDFSADDVMLNGLPMFHVAGTLVSSLAPLAAGATVVILSPAGLRHPNIVSNYWRIAERHGATVIGGVPTSLAALNEVPLQGARLDSTDVAITGASPLPLEVGRRFEQLTGKPVHEILGMTETAGLLALNPRRSPRVLGSAGFRLPFTRVEFRPMVDGEVGAEPCPAGASGMLVVSGPNVFPGYIDAQHNKGLLTDDGMLITGDLGYMDDDGRIFLTGRAKDVIIRGGHNIDPVWIESAAEAHADVDMAVAVGQPDPYAGEVPVLFVTPRPGTELEPESIRDFVHEHIAEPPARPKLVFVLDALPLTAVGKPFRPELRRRAAELGLRQALQKALDESSTFSLSTELDAGGLSVVVELSSTAGESDIDTVRRTLDTFAVRYSIELDEP